MEIDGTDGLMDLADEMRRKAKKSRKSSELGFKERAAKRSDAMAAMAATAFSKGDFQGALEWLTKAINNFPSATLYTRRSIVHLARQHHVNAAADAICAIGMDPNHASGYFCAALSMIRLGQFEDALRSLDTLRRCYPNSKNINALYVSCRNAFWQTGKMDLVDPPTSISQDPILESYSALDDGKLNDLKLELSSSGVLEASKLSEDFVRRVIETYKRGIFHLPQKYVTIILRTVLDILKDHPNIVSVDISAKQTLTVVGDLRGEFHNLLSILRHNRPPNFGRPYLFNGNIIGHDRTSLPVIIIVLCLKILFPEDVFINRGSHECLEMCQASGFEAEVLTVYDEEIMKGFTEVFCWLPVAHILNNNVLIIHGGLFEDEKITLADVQNMNRFYQPPDSGPLCDVLHSDPWNYKGISKRERQRGIWFGPDVTEQFCHRNCIDYIVRSHQNVGELGYEVQTYRQCVTVDSSTNYATYLIIRGKTSSYRAVHSRRDRMLPKSCKCFLVCNCGSPETVHPDPLHGYVPTGAALPPWPTPAKDSSKSQTSTSSESSQLLHSSKSSAPVLSSDEDNVSVRSAMNLQTLNHSISSEAQIAQKDKSSGLISTVSTGIPESHPTESKTSISGMTTLASATMNESILNSTSNLIRMSSFAKLPLEVRSNSQLNLTGVASISNDQSLHVREDDAEGSRQRYILELRSDEL